MSTDFRILFGRRLQEERNRLDLTQDDLAEKLGTKKRTLQDWERGLTSAGADTLSAAFAHQIDVRYLLTGERQTGDVDACIEPPSERALRFAQAFDALGATHQAFIEQACRMAVADSTGVAIPAYLRKLPLPKPRAFPLRTDPEDAYNRYASPDGVQPSPAQLDLRSPAAMFLAEMYDAVPLGARDLVHSLCIKVMRDYEGLTESALTQWAERRAAARPESPERRAPTAELSPVAGQKK